MFFFIDEIRVVNEKSKKFINRYYSSIYVVNAPIPLLYNFKKSPSKINFSKILFVTEFVKIKNFTGIYILLEKLSFLDTQILEINIFGDGPYLNSFKKKIKKRIFPFKIIFHGKKELKFIDKFYKNSFFLINLSKSESYSRVIVEALISNLPVLSFKSTGPNELLHQDLLIKYNDYTTMVRKILYYSKNTDEYLKLRDYAFNFKINYSTTDLIKRWKDMIFR